MTNLFSEIPAASADEVTDILINAPQVRIERIVSYGQASPAGFWYDQNEEEWVVLLKGAARLQFCDEFIDLKPGDHLHIPARKKHRVDWTTPAEPTVWLAVHFGNYVCAAPRQ
jgi:cupin 2 domain-containing protein